MLSGLDIHLPTLGRAGERTHNRTYPNIQQIGADLNQAIARRTAVSILIKPRAKEQMELMANPRN